MATVFFIDTAHNVMDYIETIYKILQPGGCWINLGKYEVNMMNLKSKVMDCLVCCSVAQVPRVVVSAEQSTIL